MSGKKIPKLIKFGTTSYNTDKQYIIWLKSVKKKNSLERWQKTEILFLFLHHK